jgi:molybdopterin-binding protein
MSPTRRSRSAALVAGPDEQADGDAPPLASAATSPPASAAVSPAPAALVDEDRTLRIGQAAELLGISVDTIRRWEQDGRLATTRSAGGQRLVQIADISRLLGERRRATPDPSIGAQSARNRFAGIVTSIRRDAIVAVVEVLAGPHRVVSLMTSEAIDDMELKVGDRAVCVVKATQVIVEVPSRPGGRSDSAPR